MRATISRCLHALKQRRSSDEGFSLIELIVVVAILGILVAIAIPVFGGIQQKAKENALETAAATGATATAAYIGENESPALADVNTHVDKSQTPDYTLAVTLKTGTVPDLTNFCVTATAVSGGAIYYESGSPAGAATKTSGPGCA